jgi:hypothetical protein
MRKNKYFVIVRYCDSWDGDIISKGTITRDQIYEYQKVRNDPDEFGDFISKFTNDAVATLLDHCYDNSIDLCKELSNTRQVSFDSRCDEVTIGIGEAPSLARAAIDDDDDDWES